MTTATRQREQQHRAVDLNRLDAEQVHRHGRNQRRGRAPREARPTTAPTTDEQHAFSQQLADQVGARRAERRPHRDFARARRGARQQQVRDVRAGDEQHEADRAHQHQQRRLDARVAISFMEVGVMVQFGGYAVGEVALEAVGKCGDVALGLLDADAWLEASGGDEKLVGPPVVAELFRREHQRRPQIGRAVEEAVEARRHHADDVVGLAVEEDLAPDDARRRRSGAARSRSSGRRPCRARRGPRRGERAAEQRLHAEDLEELRRRLRREQPLGLADAGEVGVPALADGERIEDLHALADVAVGRHGKPGFEAVEDGVVVVERHQPIGLVVRQRPQQHAVDEREDRGVRADAQRERQTTTISENPGLCRRRRMAYRIRVTPVGASVGPQRVHGIEPRRRAPWRPACHDPHGQ